MVSSIIHTKPSEDKFLILAFPTAGYISILAVNFLIHKKLLKEIGYIDIESPEQIAIVDNGKILYPIRIFEGEHGIFITSQFPVDIKNVGILTNEIFELSKRFRSKAIVTLDALNASGEKHESSVFYVSNKFQVDIKDAKQLEEGVMIGLSAGIALEAKKRDIPFVAFMAETHVNIPDGVAASKLIESLDQLVGVKTDTTELINEYKTVLSRINSLIEKTKTTQEKRSEMYG